MRAIGLCTGASTITLVELRQNGAGFEVAGVVSRPHEGNPKKVVEEILSEVGLSGSDAIAVTGRRFKEFLTMTDIPEPLAVELALAHVNGKGESYNAIISAGGETFIVYQLDQMGRISQVFTGNKCASGTGEFFIQQTRRLDVSLEEASSFGVNETPYQVSGRCSVFCKSDCTHATNRGVPRGEVVAGLSRMMARKILELLKNIPTDNVMIIGGTTRIQAMIDELRRDLPTLSVPTEATYFEALGAALWAAENPTESINGGQLFTEEISQFDFHPPLSDFQDMVTFASMERGQVQTGDQCILGLDVGSTTTKIVLVRESDLKILGSEYLRTNGDPVGASRRCYRALIEQLQGTEVHVRGLGVTGSGRKIAGLHALTDGVINEIIAHATAAIHFDQEVDTIFEIGGQDAKYTYITNGVASDYAMNEACSAGTGSFLEESALETLGIPMEEIADWAVKGSRPPNFNDQCAAFISSDIKNTYYEGISKEDIVAGLVYSICMNYVNRVKGARPVGKKVFMQGGVCYNRAVPLAMAALSGKHIIVPPEPGLMGSYGVALEVKSRLDQGLMAEQPFDLEVLADREVEYREPFTCAGGKEKCDLACSVNLIRIEDKTYPFGGACNKYYNIRQKLRVNAGDHDLVVKRQELVYDRFAPNLDDLPADAPQVGLVRSFLMNTYYPLFAHFFKELGYRPILPVEVDQRGIDQCQAPLCYPCEIAHGFFSNLLDRQPDYLFLPQIKGSAVKGGYPVSNTCPLLQGEPYYLQRAFEDRLKDGPKVFAPVLDLAADTEAQLQQFVAMAKELGIPKSRVARAFVKASAVQEELRQSMLKLGREALRELESDPGRVGVVLFGRPYSAYVPEANKGIPHKFASRGITVIPVDFLDLEQMPTKEHMYWSMGQVNLKGAEFIKSHPQLFATFITNFSCGPDSFVVGYFKDIQGRKPSLILELDNHTADAGVETRIEAFLDIVARYRNLQTKKLIAGNGDITRPGQHRIKELNTTLNYNWGPEISLFDPRLRVVFTSMGQYSTQSLAAVYRSLGINATVLPVMDEEDLKLGRGNTTCKECLPLQLTTGSLLKYLRDERPEGEITAYFMPTADGPCRFGQYQDFLRDFITKQGIEDVTILSVSSSDGYGGLGDEFAKRTWNAILLSDIFEDLHYALLALAEDPTAALRELQAGWETVLEGLEQGGEELLDAVRRVASRLQTIPRKMALEDAPQVLVVGEIYVRKEGLSRRWLPERLAEQGIVAHIAPVQEWIYYVDWLVDNGRLPGVKGFKAKLARRIKQHIMRKAERTIKGIMAETGWFIPRVVDVDHVIKTGERFISSHINGEAILTVGGPLAEVGEQFCGAIAIGPFGCMPNRLSETILSVTMDREHVLPLRNSPRLERIMQEVPSLPYLTIESDGNPFPQIIDARLETFILQAHRLHEVMQRHPART